MIYLASPYSHPDRAVMQRRFEQICEIAGLMMQAGEIVFSPIAHTHPIAVRCELPRGWDFWERYDRAMLANCDALWVAMIDGWQESKGVAGEVAIARELGIPVEYLDPTFPSAIVATEVQQARFANEQTKEGMGEK